MASYKAYANVWQQSCHPSCLLDSYRLCLVFYIVSVGILSQRSSGIVAVFFSGGYLIWLYIGLQVNARGDGND